MNDQPNLEGIRKLYVDNLTARACIDEWAQRTNSQKETSVDRTLANLRNAGSEAQRPDVIKVFRRIAELGYGRFVAGRGGQPTRLEWSGDMVSIACSVTSDPAKAERKSKPIEVSLDVARSVQKYSRRTPTSSLPNKNAERAVELEMEVSNLKADIREKAATIEELKEKNVKIAEQLIELAKESSNLKAENLAKVSIIEERQRENGKLHDELRASDRRVGELETRLQMQAPKATGGSEQVSL